MIKPRGGLCLTHEPPAGNVVVGRCGRQQFERHSPVEARVLGEIDVAHASSAQRGLNDIAAEANAGSKWHGALSVAEAGASGERRNTSLYAQPVAIASAWQMRCLLRSSTARSSLPSRLKVR